MSNFKEQYLKDLVTIEQLDDFVDNWHKKSENISLQEFLGFDDQEMKAFAHGEHEIKLKLDAIKKHKLVGFFGKIESHYKS
jgi:hypothetical protein